MSYGVGPAGYDIRVKERVELPPQGVALAFTVEHFDMPRDVLGKVADKSTWARKFLTVQNTIIEPGWRGYITLELCNHSHEPIIIKAGSPIAQIIFHLLDEPAEQPYEGKYQDQGSIPVEAIFEP